MDKAVDELPEGLKDAFSIARARRPSRQYIDAEMLSLIVPLALGVPRRPRASARPISGAEEHGHLDVAAVGAAVARRTLAAGAFVVAAIVLAAVLAVTGR